MKGKILVLSNGTILILVDVGCMAFLTRSYGVIPVPKVLDAPPSHTRTQHFIPADCSFSNANGSSLGLGFLPCQLATGSVGQI